MGRRKEGGRAQPVFLIDANTGLPVGAGSPLNVMDGGLVTLQTKPIITAGAYAANDNVGGLLTFPNAAVTAGGDGFITTMTIVDDASQSAQLELWLFNQIFTPGADNAAWTPLEADLENLVGILSTIDGTWYTGGATATVNVGEHMLQYRCVGTSLFGRLVVRDTPTFVATDDLTVILGALYA